MQCCQSERKSEQWFFIRFFSYYHAEKWGFYFPFTYPSHVALGPRKLSWVIYSIGAVLAASRIENAVSLECWELFLCLSRARAVHCIAVLRVFLLCRCLGRIPTGISTGFGLLWTVLGTVQVQRLFFLRDCYSWCACCRCVWLFIPWLH